MDCIFCKIISGELPSNKIYEDDLVMAFLDINPVNTGHTLVIPKKHYSNTLETPDELLQHLVIVVKRLANAIVKATGSGGCNISINNGEASGQIIFHAHWHIMPRFSNDGYELWRGRDMVYRDGQASNVVEKIKVELGNKIDI